MAVQKRRLKIGIDFRVEEPRQGVGTAVLALLHGLSHLQQTEQEYLLLVWDKHLDFFRPYVSGNCSLVGVPSPTPSSGARWKARLRGVAFLQWLYTKMRPASARLAASDGTAERLGCDLVHFPSQVGYTTALPTIYQPWDLQHRHYPEFFAPQDYRVRETQYPEFCRRARFVCVQTEWTRQDVIRQYDLEPEKVVVIRWGTAFEAYRQPSEKEILQVQEDLNLQEPFFLYPAITWPHKNHAVILRALAVLQQRHGRAPLVLFTGKPTDYQATLQAMSRDLKVDHAVRFLGFTSTNQIQVLFHLAQALLFPSLFEGLGLPILEAFRAGLPVISSNATVLSEVTGNAALLFDPASPEQLADRIDELQSSPLLRQHLAERGKETLANYSIDETARQFFSLYNKTVG